jgi:hypothetical protein
LFKKQKNGVYPLKRNVIVEIYSCIKNTVSGFDHPDSTDLINSWILKNKK